MPSLSSSSQFTSSRRAITREERPASARVPTIAKLSTRARAIFLLVVSMADGNRARSRSCRGQSKSAQDGYSPAGSASQAPVSLPHWQRTRSLRFRRLAARARMPLLHRLASHELAAGKLGEVPAALDQFIEGAALNKLIQRGGHYAELRSEEH